jgi:hypothetical protein
MARRLQIGAAGLAFGAALFWFLSAYGELPPMLTYWGSAPPTDPFYATVRFSAHMNTIAALLSGASALCMSIGLFLN